MADYLSRLDFVILDELGYLPFAQAGDPETTWLSSRMRPIGEDFGGRRTSRGSRYKEQIKRRRIIAGSGACSRGQSRKFLQALSRSGEDSD